MTVRLNRLQLASLRRLQRYRTVPPTYAERLRMAGTACAFLLLPFLLLGFLAAQLHVPGALPLIAGMYIGMVVQQIGLQRRFVEWWPMSAQTTDWGAVERLLAQPATAAELPAPPKRAPRWRLVLGVGAGVFLGAFALAVGIERAMAYAYHPARNNAPDGVIILTASWCGYCRSLREHLAELNIPYTDLDTEKTTEGRWGFAAVRARGVPVTIVGDQVIRGLSPDSPFTQIDAALSAAGYEIPGH